MFAGGILFSGDIFALVWINNIIFQLMLCTVPTLTVLVTHPITSALTIFTSCLNQMIIIHVCELCSIIESCFPLNDSTVFQLSAPGGQSHTEPTNVSDIFLRHITLQLLCLHFISKITF